MTMQLRTRAARRYATAREAIAPILWLAWAWTVENAPIFGGLASRRRRSVVLPPYQRTHSVGRTVFKVLSVPLVVFGCLIYGFFFALTAPYLLVPFAIPIALIAAFVIWALPDSKTAPTLPIEFLLPAYFATLVLWPKYLAITLPGMPWITLLRILGLPMGGLFLISLSVSKGFRSMVGASVTAIKPLWFCFCGFLLIQVLTTIVSSKALAAAQLVFDEQLYWTVVFIVSCVMFRIEGQIERYMALLCTLSILIIILTGYEWHRKYIPWAAHIPAILRVPDPSVQNTLTPSFRPGTYYYRAKATFATPLALAEYISLLTPFWLHFAFNGRKILLRIFCFLMVPATFVGVRMTDARLGVVGIFSSVLLFGLIWSIVRWRTRARDLLAAATVYAYPSVFLAGLFVIFASTRLRQMALGGGAEAGSTAARNTQLGMALGKLTTHPWGFGAGQAGNAMGFARGEFVTVDNYFISIVLEYGILGAILWYGTFIIGIVTAVRYCLSKEYGQRPEAKLLAPLAVTLTSFLLIKWVHGQSDNHSVYFMMLGMIVALVYRLKYGPVEAQRPADQPQNIMVP